MVRVLVTGASGMIGRSVMRALQASGHEGVAIEADATGRRWRLGALVDPRIFDGATGVVHLAWDADPATRDNNVTGSIRLVDQLRGAGVRRLVFVSSQSAGSASLTRYGSGKLAVERSLGERLDLAVRPGLVWSDPPEGIFARLVRSRILGRVVAANTGAILHPIHRDDLALILARAVVSDTPRGVLELGSRRPLSMPAVIETALGEPAAVIVPRGSLMLAGRACSLMGSRGRILSDRLRGLANLQPMTDPQDRVLGVDCRVLGLLESPDGV